MTQSRIARIRIAIAHPRLGRGGSEARALRIIEAMRGLGEITLLTMGPVDWPALNAAYGTTIRREEVSVMRPRIGRFMCSFPVGDAFRGCMFQRFCRSVAGRFDLLLSAYNLTDFGTRAIQFIADFSFDEELRTRFHPFSPGLRGLFQRERLLRKVYLGICRRVGNRSPRDPMRDDLVVANSQWVAGLIRARYGVAAKVLYPPIDDGFPNVPWEKKENGFVCIGRVAPEKRIEQIVGILSDVRKMGHDVHLHVIGAIGTDAYGTRIKKLCQANSEWVIADGRLDGDMKKAMLAAHRYGIHACQGEAFGIGVAEMVKAGCIPFVPAEGGAGEIVAHDALTYSDQEDAIKKINAVLLRPVMQDDIGLHLARRMTTALRPVFVDADVVLAVVNEFLAREGVREGRT